METIELFRQIVSDADPSDIPIKYITAACMIDKDGMEDVITGDELEALMARRYPYEHVEDINLLFDLKSLAIDVYHEVAGIFNRIEFRLTQ